MILQFSIKNFRSFREEQTLSLVASNKYDDHKEHLAAIPDDENKALPIAVMYGPNGAGKSNFVKALSLLESLVWHGTEPKKPIGRRPFLLDETSAKEPTELAIQFIEGGRAYAYGCRINDEIVVAEWLSLLREGKEFEVFERLTHESGTVEIEVGDVLKDDMWGDHSKVQALAKVSAVLPNQLFLHTIHKSVKEEEQGPVIADVLRWFGERLTIIEPDSTSGDLARLVAMDEAFTEFAGEFLREVSTGVDRLNVETAELDESVIGTVFGPLKSLIDKLPVGGRKIFPAPDGSQLIVEKGAGTKVRLRTLKSEHVTTDGKRVAFPFGEESDGTQRVTHLLPALHAIRKRPRVFVIDEIDRSLHPMLAKAFVGFFLKACQGRQSQMVLTTHDIGLMDLDLLRRDELCFADKKQDGSTELYSLSDYRVRTDLKIDKGYLQGRFGAVPFVRGVNSLLDREEKVEGHET
jgi:AAA15 family ATPase/GTPase